MPALKRTGGLVASWRARAIGQQIDVMVAAATADDATTR
jgi:hypothetical protein